MPKIWESPLVPGIFVNRSPHTGSSSSRRNILLTLQLRINGILWSIEYVLGFESIWGIIFHLSIDFLFAILKMCFIHASIVSSKKNSLFFFCLFVFIFFTMLYCINIENTSFYLVDIGIQQ